MKIVQIDPKKLNRPDWLQIWAGNWGIFSCSHFAVEYIHLIKFHGVPFLEEAVIIVKNGKGQGWAKQSDREKICSYLAKEVSDNPARVTEICNQLKKQADILRLFLTENKDKDLNFDILQKYFELLVAYYKPHINVKYVVDGLTEVEIDKFFEIFEDARVYAENILSETENFLYEKFKKIGEKVKISPELIMCCTYNEIEEYLKGKSLPNKSLLESRNDVFAVYCNQNILAYFEKEQAQEVETVLTDSEQVDQLKGMVAQKGKVSGPVKIIFDPNNASHFNQGDILITGMTRPEYLPLMKKAAAFVTDSGGLLSHAAIVARELKKPCIIGTKIATKVFKDGDMVEVDAERGVVRKIN